MFRDFGYVVVYYVFYPVIPLKVTEYSEYCEYCNGIGVLLEDVQLTVSGDAGV